MWYFQNRLPILLIFLFCVQLLREMPYCGGVNIFWLNILQDAGLSLLTGQKLKISDTKCGKYKKTVV